MFSEKSNSFKDFSDYVKESLNKRAKTILENEEFVQAAAVGALDEFADDPDQLKPMLTPDELERLLSYGKYTIDDGLTDYTVTTIEDIHSDISDDEFHKMYKAEFGVEPWEDHEDEGDNTDIHHSHHEVIDDYMAIDGSDQPGGMDESAKQIDELSNEKLAAYKKKAGEQASAANKAGDYKKADKRFSGIVKATNKQFDNDVKKRMNMGEDLDENLDEADLQELSPKTLGNYIKRASSNAVVKGVSAGGKMGTGDYKGGDSSLKVAIKRETGIKKATDKLTKKAMGEDLDENLDESDLQELSKKTLASYIKGAAKERGLAARFGAPDVAKKRQKGIEKAADKLANESCDESDLQELSKKTLASYINKAAKDVAKSSHLQGKRDMAAFTRTMPSKKDFEAQERSMKRRDGISKAVGKLANESCDKPVQYEGCDNMKDEDAAHFNTAAAKAHKSGQSHFEFGGKKYPVTIKKHHADTIHKETK